MISGFSAVSNSPISDAIAEVATGESETSFGVWRHCPFCRSIDQARKLRPINSKKEG